MEENTVKVEQDKQSNVNAFYSKVSDKPASVTKRATNQLMYGVIAGILGILISNLSVFLAFAATLVVAVLGVPFLAVLIFISFVLGAPIGLYFVLMKMVRNWTSDKKEIYIFRLVLIISLCGGVFVSSIVSLVVN